MRMRLVKNLRIQINPRFIPTLSQEQKNKRIQFCTELLTVNYDSIIFSDEYMFEIESYRKELWTAEPVYKDHVKGVLVWGSICSKGKSPLYVLDPKDTVDQAKYIEILETCLMELAGPLKIILMAAFSFIRTTHQATLEELPLHGLQNIYLLRYQSRG